MKKVYLNTLTPEEVIKRLKAGEVVKCTTTYCGEVIYRMVDGIIIKKDEECTTIGSAFIIDEEVDDYYFVEEEHFEITETGVYKTRDGRKAFVYEIDEETNNDHPVCYILEKERISHAATKQGRYSKNKEYDIDIVSKWENEE